MGIQGSNMKDSNARLRFLALIFIGVLAFGAVMYWRHQTYVAAEYVEFDIPKKNEKQNNGALKSNRYQIDVEETSPSVN